MNLISPSRFIYRVYNGIVHEKLVKMRLPQRERDGWMTSEVRFYDEVRKMIFIKPRHAT